MPEFPITVRQDIIPIYFPCSACGSYMFHYICEQPYGLALKIPFMKSPLASTHKGYHIVCVACTTVNGRFQAGDVAKLMGNLIPKSIHSLYPDLQVLYNPALFDTQKQENLKKMNPSAADQIDRFVRHYRLEI